MGRLSRIGLAACLALTVTVIAPAAALGWGGSPHYDLAEDVGWSMSPAELQQHSVAGYPYIERTRVLRPIPIIPELDVMAVGKEEGGDPGDDDCAVVPYALWEIFKWNCGKEDDYDLVDDWGARGWDIPIWVDCSVTHFWNLDYGVEYPVYGQLSEPYPNAWDKVKILWKDAIDEWAIGDKGSAYMYLGHVLHLVMDGGIPCHAHDDWHPYNVNDDSLELWFTGDPNDAAKSYMLYSWSGLGGRPTPLGGVMTPLSNEEVLASLAQSDQVDSDWWDDTDLCTIDAYNLHPLFYLMYTVNQYGDFSPSDGYDGDWNDILGWCNYLDGVIPWQNAYGDPLTGTGSEDTIAVNDVDNENVNGNFDCILLSGWRAAVRAAPAVLDLFHRTVDDVAPVSTCFVMRADGKDVAEWNNSVLTVKITNAEDGARAGFPASGVWKRWGLCVDESGSAEPPAVDPAPNDTPYWTIDTDGVFAIQLMSTDMMGNVEGPANDFVVKYDGTPPEIAFPDLRPNYLTSQDFVPLWDASDVTSGIDHVTGYLDGNMVDEGVPIDLALMAGTHRLTVYAWDKAGNCGIESYDFEVWIDTKTDALPVYLETKTRGGGMYVTIQFPAGGPPRRHHLPVPPYDVAAIDLSTCRLSVGATIDLEQQDPVTGAIVTLDGQLLTGVGDSNGDRIRDRMIRFNKAKFAAAVGGQTGDVQAVVWGGLLPDGTPRFIGYVTIPVFTTP
jgi:hypothetical protein